VRTLSAEPLVLVVVGTYPKCHAHVLAKFPKIPPKYPKYHAQMLAKVPEPKCRQSTQNVSACPYCMDDVFRPETLSGLLRFTRGGAVQVEMQLTHSLKPPGFNP
jgi:hypothetical protein